MTPDELANIEKHYLTLFPKVRKKLIAMGCPGNQVMDYFHESLTLYLFMCREGNAPRDAQRYIYVVAYRLYLKEIRERAKMCRIEHVKDDPKLAFEYDPDLWLSYKYYYDEAGERCSELAGYLIDGLSYKNIANLLNLKSARNVKDRIQYCRRKIRELMARDE